MELAIGSVAALGMAAICLNYRLLQRRWNRMGSNAAIWHEAHRGDRGRSLRGVTPRSQSSLEADLMERSER